MDNKFLTKESNVICIYNEQGKKFEELLKCIFTNLISEDINNEVCFKNKIFCNINI